MGPLLLQKMGLRQLLALVRMRLGSVPEGCWHGSRVPLVVTTLKVESARERARAPGHFSCLGGAWARVICCIPPLPCWKGFGDPSDGTADPGPAVCWTRFLPPASAVAWAQLANIWGWEGASWLCVSSAAWDATSAADQRARQEHAPEASVLHPPT